MNEIGPRIFSFSNSERAKNESRAKRWKEVGREGESSKGTLARKPLNFEKPVRPQTRLLIGAAWSS